MNLTTYSFWIIGVARLHIIYPEIRCMGVLLSFYIANLYFGYSGYLFGPFKKHSNLNVPLFIILFVQIILTISAFYLVDYFVVKSYITVAVVLSILISLFRYRHVF
jgi:hypothetical protein